MASSMSIDRNSPVPAYHQISTDLAERIIAGEWEIGCKMPSEAILAQEYDVSRITLRKALAVLESQRLITIHHGKGMYVASIPKPFIEELNFPGTTPKNSQTISHPQLLEMELLDAPPRFVSSHLKILKNEPVVYLKRIFTRDDVVIGINRAWLIKRLVEGIEDTGLVNDSISKTLDQRYGYQITQVESFVEAARLSVQDAGLLKAPYDSTALKIQSIHYLDTENPVFSSSTLWLGDMTRFHIVVNKNIPV